MMDFLKRPLNQSLIKKILYNGEQREICPHQLYNIDIIHTVKGIQTLPMMSGLYFETQCLGVGANNQSLTDLPRKKLTKKEKTENRVREREGREPILGEKKMDQTRIDEQALRFKTKCKKHVIQLAELNTQVPLIIPWEKDKNILLSMQLDIFPTPVKYKKDVKIAVIDLKLTADINSTYGEYCYGTPEHLDQIQGKMYHYGIRNIDKELNPHLNFISNDMLKIINSEGLFLLWVFNYKKADLEDKFIEMTWDKIKEAELHESIRKTIAILEMYEKQGWPIDPSYKRCKNCPIEGCEGKDHYESI